MLKEIYIKNLAVIKEAVIPLTENLNVFTGETGAGKSILINGINAVLGQRCSKDIVRTGCDKAIITALFTDLSSEVQKKLAELGILCEDSEITVTREISADGGREIGAMLINIHGQHDNQILLDSEKHMGILDEFSGDIAVLESYRESFHELQKAARRLGELKKQEQSRIQRSRYLNEVVDDIGELELEEDEDDILEREYETARNAEQTIISLKKAIHLLTGEENASELLAAAENEIAGYTDNNSELNVIYERISAAEIELSDITSELEKITEKIELNGQRMDYLKERLGAINQVKRKYGLDCNELRELYDKSSAELAQLDSSSEEITELNERKNELLRIVTERAKKLYEHRESAAEKFVSQVTAELEFLNMPNVVMAVRHEKGKLTVNGMDTVEFLISANKGEAPKPISKIASGGELSRVMLALKSVIADKDSIPTMIFDEIDTGVSGKAAQKIGFKLREIGKVRQVLCVTHLSQIAVMADNHLMIEKKIINDRTETHVSQLDFNGRKREIARIMGGEDPSELMLKNAEQEILKAQKI